MSYRALSITGGVVCGLALLCLNYGPGGFNLWSKTCATLMVAGFVVGLVFHFLASREHYGKMAAEAGMRHVCDGNFSIAFTGESAGIPLRLEFLPPGKNSRDTVCQARLELGLPSGLQAEVSGEDFLARDIFGMFKALPKIAPVPAWLEGFGVYGRPEAMALEALSRVGGMGELDEAGWTLVRLWISDGKFRFKAVRTDFTLDGDGLRTLQDACVRIALRSAGRA